MARQAWEKRHRPPHSEYIRATVEIPSYAESYIISNKFIDLMRLFNNDKMRIIQRSVSTETYTSLQIHVEERLRRYKSKSEGNDLQRL
jgi:hypothetical protein